MYKNYENRVKDFIIDMNDPKTKIEIKDYEERINNPKTELSEEKEIQKPFIFKGYTTEKDRIKDSIKRNRYLFNLPDYDEIINNNSTKKLNKKGTYTCLDNNKNNNNNNMINKRNSIRGLSESEVNKYKYILKNDLIIQPEMRFKPRTDLERIYDIINEYKYDKTEKEILNKQLKNIDLYKYKNTQDLNHLIKKKLSRIKDTNLSKLNNSYDRINNIDDNSNKKNKLYFNPKNINYKLKPWIKRDDLNIDAHKILTAYHYKTHFKAAKEVATNKNNNINIKKEKNNLNINDINNVNKNKNDIKDKKSCLLLPNLFQKKYIMNKSPTEGNDILEYTSYNNNLIDIKIDKDKDNDIINFKLDDDYNEEEKNDFNDNYTKNKNPFKKKKIFDKNKIKILNDILTQNSKNDEVLVTENNNNPGEEDKIFYNEKHIEDNNNDIIIGNEKLNKNTQFDIIANKILGNCNILKHKSKFNDTKIKKGKGKLMMTNGLSIDQFEKKFGFKK